MEREKIDIDVVFVGGGPAGIAGAIHLAKIIKSRNNGQLNVSIAVLEKAREPGSQLLSGAVIDPRALQELLPDRWLEAPFEGKVTKEKEKIVYLTKQSHFALPIIPPPLRNEGYYVGSIVKIVKWLSEIAEEEGVDIFCEFPAKEPIIKDGAVIGIRTSDRGVDKKGRKKPNFEPGVDILTKVVVITDGARGNITKIVDDKFGLSLSSNPQVYAIGIKEIWRTKNTVLQPGAVIHTMGYPLNDLIGGGFIYGMKDNLISIGLVVSLEYSNPTIDPYLEFQKFKLHPFIKNMLLDGELIEYGAKTIPEGGWWSIPRVYGDGFLIAGDAGGFLNNQRLKGIHLAMKTGMLAAETVALALEKNDFRGEILASYYRKIADSWVKDELWESRNFHQMLHRGTFLAGMHSILGKIFRGRAFGLFDRLPTEAGHKLFKKLDEVEKVEYNLEFDGKLTYDRLTGVFKAGITHDEDQPIHLLVQDPSICIERCSVEFGNPCEKFCPAGVYEIVEDDGQKRLQINASNCVHCKTCDIIDPYQIIDWVPPEGGSGPNYGKM